MWRYSQTAICVTEMFPFRVIERIDFSETGVHGYQDERCKNESQSYPQVCRMSEEGKIPDPIRRFIMTSIESIPSLEALLQCYKSPDQIWDASQIGNRLFIPPKVALQILKQLALSGFLAHDGGADRFQYAPTSDEQKRLVAQLNDYYTSHLIEITHLIHRKSGNIRKFSEAFKFKGGE